MKKDNTAPATKKPTMKEENDLLRKALAEEREKNAALSRHVSKQGAAIDANIQAREARIEAEMICIVNANAANKKVKAKKAAAKYAKGKEIEACFVKSCTRSDITLGVEIAAAAALIIAGHSGAIGSELATAFSFVLLPAIGWSLRDRSLLHKFTDVVKGYLK